MQQRLFQYDLTAGFMSGIVRPLSRLKVLKIDSSAKNRERRNLAELSNRSA